MRAVVEQGEPDGPLSGTVLAGSDRRGPGLPGKAMQGCAGGLAAI
jgi:hypothetical protein